MELRILALQTSQLRARKENYRVKVLIAQMDILMMKFNLIRMNLLPKHLVKTRTK